MAKTEKKLNTGLIVGVLAGVGAIVYFSSAKTSSANTSGNTVTESNTTPNELPAGSSSTPPTQSQTIQSFPAQITVTVSSLNVRSGPSTSDSTAGNKALYQGDQFMAAGYVHGQSVSGNDIWFVSTLGHYVWSGGTAQVPASSIAPMSTAAQTSNSSPVPSTSSLGSTLLNNAVTSLEHFTGSLFNPFGISI